MSVNVLRVKFENHCTLYDFLNEDATIEPGDKVVVESSNGLGIAVVHHVIDSSPKATAWVVQKIDLTTHNARKEKMAKLKSLKAQMEARRKKLEAEHLYKLMAQEDPTMASLLGAYQALSEQGGEHA